MDERGRRIVLPTGLVFVEKLPKTVIDADKAPREVREAARRLADEQKYFWNMLVAYAGKVGYEPPQGRQTIVLDLACGLCIEGAALSAFFGGNNFSYPSDMVKITGIDINPEEIESTAEFHARFMPQVDIEFICGDAARLQDYPQVPSEADVVVIRNQHIMDNRAVWEKIFQTAIDRVTPEGIILLTSVNTAEHIAALVTLDQLNGEIALSSTNQYAEEVEPGTTKPDRYMAIIRKRK